MPELDDFTKEARNIPNLSETVERARKAVVPYLTPEDRRSQTISIAYGEMAGRGVDITREEVAEILDRYR